jgi:hypothetical protein
MASNDEAFVYKTNPPQYSDQGGQRVQNRIRPGQLLDLYVTSSKPAPVVPSDPQPTPADTSTVNPPR